jgi:diamine N-acetyltransferase
MGNFELRATDFHNLDAVDALEVRPEQRHLVAENAYSIAQANLDPHGDCRAAYHDDVPVGFVYTRTLNEGRLLYICRFMVDHRQQGRGFGRRLMLAVLESAFACPAIELVDLAVSREPESAEKFYEKFGFISTGEEYRGGWRMELTRVRYVEWRAG